MNANEHEVFAEWCGLYVLGAMTADERERFERHLTACATCPAEVRSFIGIVHGLAETLPPREPRPELRERILHAATGRRFVGRTARPGRLDAGWFAAAACFLGLLAAGYFGWDRQRRVTELEARLQEVTSRATAAERQIADVRRTADEAQATVAVLTAPDVGRIDLAGQSPASSAAGRAYLSASRGLVFTASNLPQLPAGRTYQLWVVTGQAPISVGLVTPDPSGSVTTTFRTPAGANNPVAVALTLEPQGGVPAPTGEKYLIGTPRAAL